MRLKSKIVFILLFTLVSSCQEKNTTPAAETEPSKSQQIASPTKRVLPIKAITPMKDLKQNQKLEKMKGTVRYMSFEGGFYGIITDNNKKLLPMNLDAKFLQDGAVIEFSGNVKKGVMTIQQWGTPFVIKEMKLLKIGNSNNK